MFSVGGVPFSPNHGEVPSPTNLSVVVWCGLSSCCQLFTHKHFQIHDATCLRLTHNFSTLRSWTQCAPSRTLFALPTPGLSMVNGRKMTSDWQDVVETIQDASVVVCSELLCLVGGTVVNRQFTLGTAQERLRSHESGHLSQEEFCPEVLNVQIYRNLIGWYVNLGGPWALPEHSNLEQCRNLGSPSTQWLMVSPSWPFFSFRFELAGLFHTSVLSKWTDIFVCVRHDNPQSQRLRFLRMSHHVDLSSNKCVEGRSYKRRTDGITLSRGPGVFDLWQCQSAHVFHRFFVGFLFLVSTHFCPASCLTRALLMHLPHWFLTHQCSSLLRIFVLFMALAPTLMV